VSARNLGWDGQFAGAFRAEYRWHFDGAFAIAG
jgi:hypothetical protein